MVKCGASNGATRCQQTCDCGKPCRSSSGGPLPPIARLISHPAAVMRLRSNPSNILAAPGCLSGEYNSGAGVDGGVGADTRNRRSGYHDSGAGQALTQYLHRTASPRLVSLATAVPPHRVSQNDI